MVKGEVPGLPHGVMVGGGQRRVGLWRAVEGMQDPLGQEEVAEEAGHKQVLTKQLLKPLCRVRPLRHQESIKFSLYGICVKYSLTHTYKGSYLITSSLHH